MPSPQFAPEQPKSFLGVWVATLSLIVIFVVGLMAFPPSFEAPAGEPSSNVLFVGRFHPIFVHTPVGALLLLVLMEVFCLTRRGEEKYGPAALITLLVGAAGAILAVFAGIMLSREGGYLSGNFSLHQSMGIIGTTGVLLALVIRIYAMGQGSSELLHAYRAIFFLSFSVMGLGAHFGGNMSHGNKFLTQHAPPIVKSQITGMEKLMLSFVTPPKEEPEPDIVQPPPVIPPAPPKTITQAPTVPETTPPPAVAVAPVGGDDKLVFQHVVLPIFEAKCNKCHNEDKAKGDLRLDSFEMVMKGGASEEDGAKNIIPGKPEESLTIQRILLALEEDDHMPPDGKDQLTEGEIALLRWWIQQGASNTQKVTGAKFPPEVQPVVDEALKVASNQSFSAPNPASP
ncbi:MAG: c-type cytochrome domain-containing protein [Prosthecobacter sp.]|nr:c-type cytochrome domain-containing protein [Prosthecobacter sp.]